MSMTRLGVMFVAAAAVPQGTPGVASDIEAVYRRFVASRDALKDVVDVTAIEGRRLWLDSSQSKLHPLAGMYIDRETKLDVVGMRVLAIDDAVAVALATVARSEETKDEARSCRCLVVATRSKDSSWRIARECPIDSQVGQVLESMKSRTFKDPPVGCRSAYYEYVKTKHKMKVSLEVSEGWQTDSSFGFAFIPDTDHSTSGCWKEVVKEFRIICRDDDFAIVWARTEGIWDVKTNRTASIVQGSVRQEFIAILHGMGKDKWEVMDEIQVR
jgi:hypothetical protein